MTRFSNVGPSVHNYSIDATQVPSPFTGLPNFQQTTGTLPGVAPVVQPHRTYLPQLNVSALKGLPSITKISH